MQSFLLEKLYLIFYGDNEPVGLRDYRDRGDMSESDLQTALEDLEQRGLIRVRTAGPSYQITGLGVLYSEDNQFISEDIRHNNQHARTLILDELVRIYDEERWFSDAHVNALSSKLGVNLVSVIRNLRVLDDLGYVRPSGFNSYLPTELGSEAVRDFRKRQELVNQLERIEDLRPQTRGREFQKLFGRVIELYGWLRIEGLRTSHEEIDVIVHKRGDYYLVECKWRKGRIQSSVVRELFGKLKNRAEIRGVLVSMSGFTSGAMEQVRDFADTRLILLFGKDDFLDILRGIKSFDELLEERRHDLIIEKKAVFK